MDFFGQQVRAKRISRWLLVLFLIAVVGLLILTHAAIAFTLHLLGHGYQRITYSYPQSEHWQIYLSICILSVIAIAIFYKWRQLQPGGRVMAESLGASRILPQNTTPQEKQLLNVVEEIALASGLPAPPLYCLDDASINAFAAGFTPADAVIGVTRGTLDQLTRDELQGVIAHEFSHIINGDMRLNAQLLALLFGIEFIGHAGHFLVHTNPHTRVCRENSGALLGIILLGIGYAGTLFAKIIKAAINRQREYLADAAAVQFTRHADGLANALLKVASVGSVIDHPQAHVMGHFFFGNAISTVFTWSLLTTHPSLEKRLLRIKPQWTQGLLKRKTLAAQRQSHLGEGQLTTSQSTATHLASAFSSSPSVTTPTNIEPVEDHPVATHNDETQSNNTPSLLPTEWRQRVHEPYEACLLVYALAFAKQDSSATLQCQLLLKERFLSVQSTHNQLSVLTPSQRWQLLALTIPSIKLLSTEQYISFKKILRALIQIDNRIDLFEWSLFELVTHSCDAQLMHRSAQQPYYHQMESVLEEYVYVLSLLIQHLHTQPIQHSTMGSMNQSDNLVHHHIFEKALTTIGIIQTIPWKPVQWQWPSFHNAQKKLALANPLLKALMIKGWVQATQPLNSHNPLKLPASKNITTSNINTSSPTLSTLSPDAQHLLTALAACLDVPFLLME